VHPFRDKASSLKIKWKIVLYGTEFHYIHKNLYLNISILFLFIHRYEDKRCAALMRPHVFEYANGYEYLREMWLR
jgi:hypothetical protein